MSRENIAMGRVVAVGPGKEVARGHREPVGTPEHFARYEPIDGIKVGDVIFVNMRRVIPCSPDTRCKLGMVDADDVLATVEIEPEVK